MQGGSRFETTSPDGGNIQRVAVATAPSRLAIIQVKVETEVEGIKQCQNPGCSQVVFTSV